jgi:hypothetical protein
LIFFQGLLKPTTAWWGGVAQLLLKTHKQFHVVVEPASAHPSTLKLAPQLAQAHELYPNLLEFVDLVLYTRVDSDDALERSAVATLQVVAPCLEPRSSPFVIH